jgi:hypothetical protein
MQDPSPEISDDDPLLGFSSEAPPVEPHVAETKADRTPPPLAESGRTDDSVIGRVAELERQLERSLIEIANLRSDVATLVGALADMKKRQSEPPKPASVPRTSTQLSRRATAMVAIIVAMLGVAAWGALSLATSDGGVPPPVETGDSAALTEPPAPIADQVDTPMAVQTVAAISTLGPERAAPALPPPRPAASQPAPEPQEAPPPPAGGYVGTLSIDASPAGDVFLNRKSVGRTPVRLEQLRAGSHLIWIERDGYRRWTRVVPVAANRVSRVSAELDPIR